MSEGNVTGYVWWSQKPGPLNGRVTMLSHTFCAVLHIVLNGITMLADKESSKESSKALQTTLDNLSATIEKSSAGFLDVMKTLASKF